MNLVTSAATKKWGHFVTTTKRVGAATVGGGVSRCRTGERHGDTEVAPFERKG